MTTTTYGPIQTLTDWFHRAVWLYRTRGKSRLFYSVLCRLVSLPGLRHCVHLRAFDLCHVRLAESPAAVPHRSLFTVRLAQPADLPALSRYFGHRKRVDERLARGDLCVVAMGGNSIGAAVWLAVGPASMAEDWHDLRCTFRIPAGVAWSYDGRGTKIGGWGTLMNQVPAILRTRRVKEIVTLIGGNNWQSLDAHRSLGYTKLGTILHVRICGLCLWFFQHPGGRWRLLPTEAGCVEIVKNRNEAGPVAVENCQCQG